MEEFGATRIYSLGLGDDDGNLEEDFMRSEFIFTVPNLVFAFFRFLKFSFTLLYFKFYLYRF